MMLRVPPCLLFLAVYWAGAGLALALVWGLGWVGVAACGCLVFGFGL